jgi:N-formylglutamate amidohydrolase
MPHSLFQPAFEVREPAEPGLPAVLNSPHSGRHYPSCFVQASRLTATRLRMSEDCYVDELFSGGIDAGAPMMAAQFPRAYLDVNREAWELDPAMFHGPLPDYVNTASPRVAGGLGTIARVVSETEEIYAAKLTFDEARARVKALYEPYHRALARLIENTRARFGAVVLIDCHSMPSADRFRRNRIRPDVVLGDRCGHACEPQIVDFFDRKLSALGLKVVRNQPYAGGYITQKYGQPHLGRHAIQIEVNRALYLDEKTLIRHSGFNRLKSALDSVFEAFAAELPVTPPGLGLAAE